MIEEGKLAGLPVHKRNTEHVFMITSIQYTFLTNAHAFTFEGQMLFFKDDFTNRQGMDEERRCQHTKSSA